MRNENKNNLWLSKVEFLSEVLPYMHQYNGSSLVIKYGGHAMTDKEMQISFASDIALLQQVGSKPVVVHGLSLIHISEPTRLGKLSYAVFC